MSEKNGATEATNLIDLLDRLTEPNEPEAVSLLPQTTGWLVVAVLLAAAIVWMVWRTHRNWRNNAYRRAALEELEKCHDNPSQIADVVRRTALTVWPRKHVAGLIGDDWLAFLDQTCGGTDFKKGAGRLLISGPYAAGGPASSSELKCVVARWIRNHRNVKVGHTK